MVVLEEAPTAAAAEKALEAIRARNPDWAKLTSVSVRRGAGPVHHWVVACGYADRRAAQRFAAQLWTSRSVKPVVEDIRLFEHATDAEAFRPSPPEGAAVFERLASLLPDPGADRIESMMIERRDAAYKGAVQPFGRTVPLLWYEAFAGLGWQATAQAQYRSESGEAELRVLVGWLGEKRDPDRDAVREVVSFLQAHVLPDKPAEPPDEEAVGKKKKKTKRKRARRAKRRPAVKRAKRRRAPSPPVAPVDPLALTPLAKELPAAVRKRLPWGEADVRIVEKVALRKPRPNQPSQGETHTAWICSSPDERAVLVVIFDNADLATELLSAVTLGDFHGMVYSDHLGQIWQSLPEVTEEGEQLAYVGMQRLGRRLPRDLLRADWAKVSFRRAFLLAGYRSRSSGWQMSWVELGSTSEAQRVYEEGMVAPRQKAVQSLLHSKKDVDYTVGVSIKDIGDVQGWLYKGAMRGRLQEFYFKRGREVWLVQADAHARGGPGFDGLQARLDTLQIWDRPARP